MKFVAAEKTGKKVRIGIVDTMFARADMASFAIGQISKDFPGKVEILRSTVPGVKDLAVGCLLLHKKEKWNTTGLWLRSAGASLFLFGCYGASQIPALTFLTNDFV